MFRPPVRALPFALFLAFATAAAPAGFAQDAPQVPPPVAVPNPTPDAAAPDLTVEQSVAQALAKNFAVRIQNFSVASAKDSVIIAQSVYDPVLGVTWEKTVTQSPVATNSTNTAQGGNAPYINDQSTILSVSQPVITGGNVSASYNLARDASNSIQSLLNPAYDGQMQLNVSQPLLAGAGTDYNRALIKIAQYGQKIAELNLKSSVLTTIFNVETAYYNLIYARRQYNVGQDAVKLAQQLLDENRIKRQTGVLTDLDVVTAEAGVATAQSQLIGFKQAMDNAQDTLLAALGERAFQSAVGTITFPPLPSTDVSVDLSYKLARDNGPNLAVVQATIEQYKLDALRAKRNDLPTLNATGGVGYSAADHSYSDVNSTIWNGPGYNWSVGLALSFAWGQRANRALYRQAMNNVGSEETVLDQTDQTLIVQVRAAVRAVQSNLQGVSAAHEAAVLSQKQYDLQKAKFDAGLATSYDVLQAQNLLEAARSAELQSEVTLRIAIADLHFLEGTSLEAYHVNLKD